MRRQVTGNNTVEYVLCTRSAGGRRVRYISLSRVTEPRVDRAVPIIAMISRSIEGGQRGEGRANKCIAGRRADKYANNTKLQKSKPIRHCGTNATA